MASPVNRLLFCFSVVLLRSALARVIPKPLTSFYWQLSGDSGYPSTSDNAAVYDIDGFGTPNRTMQVLRARGTKVMCYFSFGTAEDYRPDYKDFPKATLGGLVCNEQDDNGKCINFWQGERWVDVRSNAVRRILENRIKLAASKGCHGIEPDNTNAWSNNLHIQPITTFSISKQDQLNFNKWIAQTCHKYGLSVGLKNPDVLVPALASSFDWALVEQCNEYTDWSAGQWYAGKYQCDYANYFIVLNKAVHVAVYDAPSGISWPQGLCTNNNAHGFSTRRYSADVGPQRYPAYDCLKHRTTSCAPWKKCIKPAMYQKYNVPGSGMQKHDMIGQCVRANMQGCGYQ